PSDHRSDAVAGKVDVVDRLVRLVEWLSSSKGRRGELRYQPAVLGGRKRGQNTVCVPSLGPRFGHISSRFRHLLPFHWEHILCRTDGPVCTAAYRQTRLLQLASQPDAVPTTDEALWKARHPAPTARHTLTRGELPLVSPPVRGFRRKRSSAASS